MKISLGWVEERSNIPQANPTKPEILAVGLRLWETQSHNFSGKHPVDDQR